MKARYSDIDKKINEEYFNSKVDLIPATIKDIYADFVSKEPCLVRRELIIGDRVFLGVEYGNDGKTVVSAYTSDTSGKRVNIENLDTSENLQELPLRPKNMLELSNWMLKSTRDRLNTENLTEVSDGKSTIKQPKVVKKSQKNVSLAPKGKVRA